MDACMSVYQFKSTHIYKSSWQWFNKTIEIQLFSLFFLMLMSSYCAQKADGNKGKSAEGNTIQDAASGPPLNANLPKVM